MLLKGKRSHEPSCALPGQQAHRQRCIPTLCQPQHCLPWALLTSLLKTDMTWTGLPGCCPSSGGLAAELVPRSPVGVSSVLGAAVRNTSPSGRVMGEGRLCHTC